MNLKMLPKFIILGFVVGCYGALDLPDQFYKQPKRSEKMEGTDKYASLDLKVPFKLHGRSAEIVWVNENGFLSFPLPVLHSSFPQPFRINHGQFSYSTMIMVFWTDHILPLGGAIYYKEIRKEKFLNKVTTDIQNKFGECANSFQALSVSLFTWHKVYYSFDCVRVHSKEFCDCLRDNSFDYCTCVQDGNPEQFCEKCLLTPYTSACRCLQAHSPEYCDCVYGPPHVTPDYCSCIEEHDKTYCDCFIESGSVEDAKNCSCHARYPNLPQICECMLKNNFNEEYCSCLENSNIQNYRCPCYLTNNREFCDCYSAHGNEGYCRCLEDGSKPEFCLCHADLYRSFFYDQYLTAKYCDCTLEYPESTTTYHYNEYCWCLGENRPLEECEALKPQDKKKRDTNTLGPGNTYQIAVATDGNQTYVIFNYDLMTFPLISSVYDDDFVGPAFYDSTGPHNSYRPTYYKQPFSWSMTCSSLPHTCRHTESNVGVAGTWMYRVDGEDIVTPDHIRNQPPSC